LPPNTDWNTLRNDSDSVAQNERNLELFLQLAAHTANHLTHLRKKTDKGYDCNRRNDNSISMTEALITQSPSQTNPEWLDKSQKIQTYSSSDDSEINFDQNQTTFSQLQELSDLKNIDDNRDTERNLNSKMNNLIPKFIQDTSSDIDRHNHEALGYKLNSDAANNSLNANEFRSDSLESMKNNVNKKVNQIDPKNITNISIMDDLTETVNQFFPNPQNLQESFEISQRLFGTDLAQIVPKIISDVHRNANQFIPPQNTQNIRKLSDKIDDVNQRFFNPIIKTAGNIMNSQTADNLSIVNQILSNTKNIVESMIKILPEAAKGANLLNQVIPQDTVNTPLKVAEEGKKYLAQSDYTHQEQNKNTKHTQASEQFNNLLHNRQDLINNLESNIRETVNTSEKNNQETKANDLPINENNSTAEDNNKQHIPTLLKDSSIPFLRFLSDFNEQENNNNKTETDLSSIQTNEKANNSNDEKLSIRDRKKTNQRLDQIEEIKAEGFKQMNETRMDFSDGQLNPISDLSQKSKENELTDVAVATSTSPNQLEFSIFTLDSITEYRAKNSSGIQDSENVSDVIKSDLEEARRYQDNSFTNDKINQSTENQIIYVDDILQLNNHSLIDDLKSEDLYKQLSAKLQEISDRLINALQSIIEKKMDNQNYMTDHYSKQ